MPAVTQNPLLRDKVILQMVRQLREPSAFILDLFFWQTETFDTQQVFIDTYLDEREIAVFTSPNSDPNLRQRTEWTRKPYNPPYIFETLALRPDQLHYIMAGESEFANRPIAERLVDQLAEDTLYLIAIIKRKLEWWASQLIDGGAVTIQGSGINSMTHDFNMPTGNILALTIGDRWSQATATPLKDLRTHRTTIGQASGKMPTVAILGNEARDRAYANQEFKDYMDIRRANNVISLDIQILPRGVTYIGNFEGMDLFTYDEQYIEGGALKRFIKSNRVYMGSPDAKTVRAHGAILNFLQGLKKAEWAVTPTTDQRGRVYHLDAESSPFLGLSESNAFGYIDVGD